MVPGCRSSCPPTTKHVLTRELVCRLICRVSSTWKRGLHTTPSSPWISRSVTGCIFASVIPALGMIAGDLRKASDRESIRPLMVIYLSFSSRGMKTAPSKVNPFPRSSTNDCWAVGYRALVSRRSDGLPISPDTNLCVWILSPFPVLPVAGSILKRTS